MTRKVLLIDDDRIQFRVTEAQFRQFQNETYTLEWADSFESGLVRLISGDYAACLLDYQLGDRDGLQLIHAAVERGCRTPIIFLTAETADRVDIGAMNAGALDYLVKGEITPRMLERSLRYALKLGETLEALHNRATHDDLTGLLNRREFERILREEEERAKRFGHPVSLVLLDLDHFKAVNDVHGHPAGDAVLRETAQRLKAAARTVDRVARIGGEEFGFILIETNAREALAFASRVVAALRDGAMHLPGGTTIVVTASAGVAGLPQHATTAATLVAAADKALYAAKARGRNQAIGFEG